ncbi:MAG: hypothetical protein EOO88_42260, partial [Pedobacter sp.]
MISKLSPVFASLLLCLSTVSFGQKSDSALLKKLNAQLELDIHQPGLWVDSVSTAEGNIKLYFSRSRSFAVGEIDETTADGLVESFLHLTDEYSKIHFLVIDRATNNWVPMQNMVTSVPRVEYKERVNTDPFAATRGGQVAGAHRVFPTGGQGRVAGPLAGKTVWLSQSHGWHNTGAGFVTQRGAFNQIVEDFVNAETIDYYLIHYLMSAGANVWTVRERDMNTREIIVNNDQGAPAYTETGSWTDGSIAGYGGTYRTSSSSNAETSSATYTPTVDSSGLYWVSVRFVAGANRATDVRYRIVHAGGTTDYTVNQEVHGDTWVYLGQFYFFAGGNYSVTISNESAEASQAIIADAVRLGGGKGQDPDCLNGGAASNRPRYEESARMYANYQGYPTCREDVTMRPVYTEWELSKGYPTEKDDAIFLSLHTNGGGGTGTESFMHDGTTNPVTAGSLQLRDSVQKQI